MPWPDDVWSYSWICIRARPYPHSRHMQKLNNESWTRLVSKTLSDIYDHLYKMNCSVLAMTKKMIGSIKISEFLELCWVYRTSSQAVVLKINLAIQGLEPGRVTELWGPIKREREIKCSDLLQLQLGKMEGELGSSGFKVYKLPICWICSTTHLQRLSTFQNNCQWLRIQKSIHSQLTEYLLFAISLHKAVLVAQPNNQIARPWQYSIAIFITRSDDMEGKLRTLQGEKWKVREHLRNTVRNTEVGNLSSNQPKFLTSINDSCQLHFTRFQGRVHATIMMQAMWQGIASIFCQEYISEMHPTCQCRIHCQYSTVSLLTSHSHCRDSQLFIHSHSSCHFTHLTDHGLRILQEFTICLSTIWFCYPDHQRGPCPVEALWLYHSGRG